MNYNLRYQSKWCGWSLQSKRTQRKRMRGDGPIEVDRIASREGAISVGLLLTQFLQQFSLKIMLSTVDLGNDKFKSKKTIKTS